jgi:hypothetical protein
MTGGIASVVHRLTIDHGGYRDVLVLRQYEYADSDMAAGPGFAQSDEWLESEDPGPDPGQRGHPGDPRLGDTPGRLGGRLRHPAAAGA